MQAYFKLYCLGRAGKLVLVTQDTPVPVDSWTVERWVVKDATGDVIQEKWGKPRYWGVGEIEKSDADSLRG